MNRVFLHLSEKRQEVKEKQDRESSLVIPPSYWATHSNLDKYIVVFSTLSEEA